MKTVKEYLKECNRDLLLDTVVAKHIECSFTKEDIDPEECKEGYGRVLDKLTSFGEWTWFRKQHTVWFQELPEMFAEEGEPQVYIDVCLRNKNYIEPDEGLKPWGGDCEDRYDAPEGHYNINWNDYNERFSVSMPWRVVVNLEAEFDDSLNGYELENILAEFLWEVTFDGFEERSYQSMRKNLEEVRDRIDSGEEECIPFDEAIKDIRDYAEIRGEDDVVETKNGMKIEFAASALEDIKEIIVEDIRHNGGEGNDCELD